MNRKPIAVNIPKSKEASSIVVAGVPEKQKLMNGTFKKVPSVSPASTNDVLQTHSKNIEFATMPGLPTEDKGGGDSCSDSLRRKPFRQQQ